MHGFMLLKGTLNKMFAPKILSDTERLGATFCRHNFHFRQKLMEKNELNEFFTNCSMQRQRCELEEVMFNTPGNGSANFASR